MITLSGASQPGAAWRGWARVVCGAAVLAVSGCSRHPGLAASSLPPELAVPDGATDVEPRGDGGVYAVRYRLSAPYPASAFLRDVQARLVGRGWKPMERDPLNPAVPTSNVRGWTAFVDASARPVRGVHQWLGSWRNEKGDVVSYALRYGASANEIDGPPSPGNTDLTITAFLTPAGRAREMADAAERLRRR